MPASPVQRACPMARALCLADPLREFTANTSTTRNLKRDGFLRHMKLYRERWLDVMLTGPLVGATDIRYIRIRKNYTDLDHPLVAFFLTSSAASPTPTTEPGYESDHGGRRGAGPEHPGCAYRLRGRGATGPGARLAPGGP